MRCVPYAYVLLLLTASHPVQGASQTASWHVVRNCPKATPVFRNSHSTAMAQLVRYHGLSKPGEKAKSLVAICWMYAQYCECDKPDKPTLWRIGYGIKKLFVARGRPKEPVRELCRVTRTGNERASFGDYVAAIHGDRPVVVTFCYDPRAGKGLAQAVRRDARCLSALGIGYVKCGRRSYLICQDGVMASGHGVAAADVVEPSSLGLSSHGKPWTRPGTSLYRWDGAQSNVVLTFVGRSGA